MQSAKNRRLKIDEGREGCGSRSAAKPHLGQSIWTANSLHTPLGSLFFRRFPYFHKHSLSVFTVYRPVVLHDGGLGRQALLQGPGKKTGRRNRKLGRHEKNQTATKPPKKGHFRSFFQLYGHF
jgi:hypothetical protein